jgi:transposase-like protein
VKKTVMDIRHMKLEELRQLAVAQLDEIEILHVRIEEFDDLVKQLQAPIPMILFCPMCKERHIDKGKFAVQPHKSHSCQGCGFTWSPCHLPTVGVHFLPGYKDGS